jgi:AcrR family transcriptional regulator
MLLFLQQITFMDLVDRFQIPVLEEIAVRNPQSTRLGQRIIEGSIFLIDELGFEQFTFKKLALSVGTTEASVYRYFSSKQKLLLYLINWYWGRLECRLLLQTQGGTTRERLEKALELVLVLQASTLSFSSEKRLQRIVIHEAPKVFLTKAVDSDHQTGYHSIYTEIVRYISDLIRVYQPACKYPEMLVTTLLEGSHQQRFFSQHLPEVTNASEQEDAVAVFYKQLFFSYLDHEQRRN